jgi:hypothetical protein
MTPEITPSLSVNQPLSERVAREVDAKPNECLHTASRGLLCSDASSPLRHARYVEGTCYTDAGYPFDHAWLELDGEIIDPTFTAVVARKVRVLHKGVARQVRAATLRELAAGYRHRYEAIARYTYEELYAYRVAQRGELPMTPYAVRAAAQLRALGVTLPARFVPPE